MSITYRLEVRIWGRKTLDLELGRRGNATIAWHRCVVVPVLGQGVESAGAEANVEIAHTVEVKLREHLLLGGTPPGVPACRIPVLSVMGL